MDFTFPLLWDVKGREEFSSESLSQKHESVTEPLGEIPGFQSVLMTKPRLSTSESLLECGQFIYKSLAFIRQNHHESVIKIALFWVSLAFCWWEIKLF